jgi:hypothetical protein
MNDINADDQGRYEAAAARLAQIKAEWTALGCPLIHIGTRGHPVEHVLVQMMRRHEHLLDQLGIRLRRSAPGRSPVAVIKPPIRPSPASRLRVVRTPIRRKSS